MIKPKYQYLLLPFHYSLITLIAIINYILAQKYKQALIIFILLMIMGIVGDLIIYEIIFENFNLDIGFTSLREIYIEVLNIGIGYLLIRNQKKNIKFTSIKIKEVKIWGIIIINYR